MRYVLTEITLPLVAALVVGVVLGRWLFPRRVPAGAADAASRAASDVAWVRELAADDDVVLDALNAPAAAHAGSLDEARAEIDDLRWRIRERDALVAELREQREQTGEPSASASTVDDLTLVWGVTPEIAEVLRRAGIERLAQLETCSAEQLRALLDDAGDEFAAVDPASWPRQAALWAGRRPG